MKSVTPLAVLAGAGMIAIAAYFGLMNMAQRPAEVKGKGPDPEVMTILQQQAIILGEITMTLQDKKGEGTEVKRVALNEMSGLLDDIGLIYIDMQEAFKENGYDDVARHADDIEKLSQQIRKAGSVLSGSDYVLIKRDIAQIQHTAHEVEHAAEMGKHEDSHHAADTLKRDVDTLRNDIQDFRRRHDM